MTSRNDHMIHRRTFLASAAFVATAREPTGPAMPSFAWQLNDAQVAALATYVRDRFGNKATSVNEGDAKRARASLAGMN
jgi:mono/diheme cytochrome c family protein